MNREGVKSEKAAKNRCSPFRDSLVDGAKGLTQNVATQGKHTRTLSPSHSTLSYTLTFPLSLSLCPTPSLTRRDVMTLAGKAAENGFAQDSLPPPQIFSYKQQTNTLTHSCKRKKRIHLLVLL